MPEGCKSKGNDSLFDWLSGGSRNRGFETSGFYCITKMIKEISLPFALEKRSKSPYHKLSSLAYKYSLLNSG